MFEFMITYFDNSTEVVKGYNIFQALGCIKGNVDNIHKVQRIA